MKSLFLLITLFVLASCSTAESEREEEELRQKNYSDETNRAFEMIERGYSRPPVKKASPYNPPQVEQTVTEKYTPPPKTTAPRSPVAPARSARALPEKKFSEKLVELNQNLAFYCMKHRKDPVFKNDEKKCMDHVNGILQQCQKQHSTHSKLLKCVKKKLNFK